MNLNKIIKDLEKMLIRLIGEHITLKLDLRPDLKMIKVDPSQIDLILTDIIMPEISGVVLANELKKKGIVKNVLYISGYTENIIAKFGVVNEGIKKIISLLIQQS